MNKIPSIILVVVIAISCQPNAKQGNIDSSVQNNRPNIIIINTDDQGYTDLGKYGAKGFTTPFIDKMADEGITFTNFHVAESVCSVSRAALLTGCYPVRLGLRNALVPKQPIGLNPEETTIAELLKPLGYKTAIFGKWHLGDHPAFLPTRQGFDEYFGIPYSHDMWPGHPWQGTVFNFPPLPLMQGEEVVEVNPDFTQLTTLYTERAVKFIEENKEKPFFLYVAHSMPHVPLAVSDKFKGKSESLYGDVMMEIDWSVGEILKALDAFGIDQNTIVIFTSDNGPWLTYGGHSGSAFPFREGKSTSFEGGTRVPYIMKWPARIQSGLMSDELAMTIDILPTIAKITGAKLPDLEIDGKNILPLFLGTEGAKSPHEGYFFYRSDELQAVMVDQWKLVFPHTYLSVDSIAPRNDGVPVESYEKKIGLSLYDLKKDRSETVNLAEKYPAEVARLQALADGMRDQLGDKLTNRKGTENREPGRWLGEGK